MTCIADPEHCAPFLKWPGGKRWLVPQLLHEVKGTSFRTYYEPFLGGAALFFALRPRSSVLSDANGDLINTYRQVRKNPELLIRRLRSLNVSRKTYDAIRARRVQQPVARAVRFLFLNRTAFGGVYRLNRQGLFNVPYGGGERTPTPLWEHSLLRNAAKALRASRLVACDFEESLSRARSGDLVYCDPTYTVAHNNNGFVRYNEKNFSWNDQQRLATGCKAAARRGAFVLVSNAYHREVLQLFAPPRYQVVSRMSLLCPDPAHRRPTAEFLFVYPPKQTIASV